MARRNTPTRTIAAALGVRPATVRKYARDGRIPFDTTPGGHRRFDLDEVRRALAGGRRWHAPLTAAGEEDRSQIRERLRWSPAERLRYLLDMLAFEESAHRSTKLRR